MNSSPHPPVTPLTQHGLPVHYLASTLTINEDQRGDDDLARLIGRRIVPSSGFPEGEPLVRFRGFTPDSSVARGSYRGFQWNRIIRDIVFDGDGRTSGVVLDGLASSLIERVTIRNTVGTALEIRRCQEVGIDAVVIANNIEDGEGSPLVLIGGEVPDAQNTVAGPNHLWFSRIRTYHNDHRTQWLVRRPANSTIPRRIIIRDSQFHAPSATVLPGQQNAGVNVPNPDRVMLKVEAGGVTVRDCNFTCHGGYPTEGRFVCFESNRTHGPNADWTPPTE